MGGMFFTEARLTLGVEATEKGGGMLMLASMDAWA